MKQPLPDHPNLSLAAKPANSAESQLIAAIKQWGKELGFADVGITNTDLSAYEADYFNWLGENFHGEMDYMARHGTKRTRPNELEPGTRSIISVRMNYLDLSCHSAIEQLHNDGQAYISRYALGKDYHKLVRKRLQTLADKIANEVADFSYRAFTDSAPVLERPIAEKAGLGFIGKNSLIIHPRAGSWFFLGELYTNLQLPADPPFEKQGCGPCNACIVECPTQAIMDNTVVDARRCISYLTIEYKGSIPIEFRSLMGNRIYGCDDCQLVCPWNKFTTTTQENAFHANHQLDNQTLLNLWQWSESDFLDKLQGSPIRRIGYAQWIRNLAIAIGNLGQSTNSTTVCADTEVHDNLEEALQALHSKLHKIDALVDEHILWAKAQLTARIAAQGDTNIKPYSLKNTAVEIIDAATPVQRTTHLQSTKIKPFIARKYYLPSAR